MRRAAKMFHVPFSTVQRYIRTPPKGQKPGPGTVLTAEEEARIKTWVLYMSRAGFPLSESDILSTVSDYAEKIRKTRNIPSTFPCRNWTRCFLERHPDLRKKRVTKLSKAGAVVTEQQIRHWFLEVEETLQEDGIDLSIFDEPERIYNFDESGFKLVPQDFNAICGPNVENSYFVHNNSSKDNYTVLFGSNAEGTLTPPMILYPGKRVTREIVENTPNGWSVGVSDEGWQTSKTFFEYMTNDFYKWLLDNHIKFPVVVFVDGHKSHISIELTEFCTAHEIMLIALYPNSTRILQPLDRQFFVTLK
ncbi:uncharacterized protein LOC110680248 [Aedes aegypti]|uniref:HTH CENPB-type domain-containing protein n=1 Tax=Aedes aegypti TaxID=7159 RepID=A0A6I8U0N3_AEDAE|nr:uncharacterized protein LOC110675179 [Aedes aegypti]XP_021706436.1 uncharacterized protein LOC110678136 [Aedes aegypti]XP_021711752.1 uncharacterized protein LOC110680248 [Aedes aegypti]